LSTLQHIDRDLLLWINGLHADWLDPVMWWISKPMTSVGAYALLAYAIIKRYKSDKWWLVLISFGVLIFFCDFVVTHAFKYTIQRLRPSHHPEIQSLLHLLSDENGQIYRGGKFGFFSSHSSNNMGLVTLFVLWMRPVKKHIVALLLIWVLTVSYSRIYLGVHYPGDILAGLIYGAMMGWLIHAIFKRWFAPPVIA
jgi:undecaprenyl-diphosphatase